MILVTVGTQFFDPLVEEVDRLAGQGVIQDRVVAQIGLAHCIPQHIEHFAFDHNECDNIRHMASDANLIISHAGTGSLCELIDLGKPFIAVVNNTKAGNHQLEFCEYLATRYDFCWIDSPDKLASALPEARPATPIGQPTLDIFVGNICEYIETGAQPSAVGFAR